MVRKTGLNKNYYYFLGIVLFFCIWQTIAWFTSDIIIASPLSALLMLFYMVKTKIFWEALGITMARLGISILIGTLSGLVLGLVAGLNTNAGRVFEPVRWSLMSMPPVVVVTIGMIWFGMGGRQTVFVTSLLILPIMYLNTVEGVESIDPDLLELGQVYKADLFFLLKSIYLPGMAGSLLTGVVLSAGLGLRLIILAEVLGAHTGIGYEFSMARTNLDAPAIFAWILVCLIIVGFFEFGLLNPAKQYIMKWKKI